MTGLETISILVGIVILSITITNALMASMDEAFIKNSTIFKIFIFWISFHFTMAFDKESYKAIVSVSKTEQKYYLSQYKRSDILLDKEMYDKFKALGNDVYIHQDFYVSIRNNGVVERYSISKKTYYDIVDNKLNGICLEHDLFGNKSIKED